VRLRLTPQDTSFFDLFAAQAATLVEGASMLAELLGEDQEGRERIAQDLRDAEHRADEATHAIMRRLNSSFITPFDRQDIYALASGLDDCMDDMEAAADLIVLYKVGELPAGVADQVAVLQRQAEVTADAMPRLRSLKDLADYWVEINRLENQADRTYRKLLSEMFENTEDAIRLIKLREIVGELESAADAFEKVAHTVETIAVKES
jgi:predicted phosphate transport protein (TIGR00153 family)